MMRRLAIGAAVVALLVVAYGAAMYWIAPRVLHQRLVEQAREAGVELAWQEARVNPFTLVIRLRGVRAGFPKARLEAEAPEATIAVGWATLWKRALVIDHLSVPQGSVRWAGARKDAGLEFHPLALDVHALSMVPNSRGTYEAHAQIAGGGTLDSQGEVVLSPVSLEGELHLAGARLAQVWALAVPGDSPIHGELDAKVRVRFDKDGGLKLGDFAAQAALEPSGRLSASGAVALQPLGADLKVEAAGVGLSAAQPWLEKAAKLRIASGALSGSGRLRVEKGDASYEGSLAVEGLRLDQPETGPLVAWRKLQTGQAQIAFSPFAAHFGEMKATAPEVRLEIEPDGSTNLSGLTRKHEPSAQAAVVSIRHLTIEDGKLHFADRSLRNPFTVQIAQLAGTVSGFAVGQDAGGKAEPAQLALAGRVGEYGEASIRGRVDLKEPRSLTDVRAAFRNLDLVKFSPYAVKFAGYQVRAGRLDADLRYRVRESRLVGDNRVTLNHLQLGEKVAERGALDIPVDLALALLTDAKGQINVAIPVHGDLRDPKFSLAGLVASALANSLGKLVSAPFRALAAVFGGKNRAEGEVRFEPGSVALDPPQEQNIERIARALEQRPRLAVTVRGGFDPKRDPPAVLRRGLRLELARRAGYELPTGAGPDSVDLRDPKVRRAAEKAFLERGGSRAELARLPRGDAYGRALFEQLAARTGLPEDLETQLANARAETVRAALVEKGIPADRVQVGKPAEPRSRGVGVPTELALAAAG